jgi:multicomponent K+:H+ antiporter subunit D
MLVLGNELNISAAINIAATFALAGIAVILLVSADNSPAGIPGVYRLGNWPAPFAIVLVADRLAALMLLLTSLIGTAAAVFSLGRWHRVGAYFHPLFQFLLMGVNGAFLTGDLFNLFVFFEVLLAASYGLALHGSGSLRVKASLHYIVVNLIASLLFLIGVSLIYGVSGTLNMAHLANLMPRIQGQDRALLESGASILGIAFLVKAGTWPLCFWLPNTYASATPPVAGVFAILTKVGAYAVLRLWLLLFGADTGTTTQFGGGWLFAAGIATVAYGVLGSLGSATIARFSAFSLLVSSGTVLAAISIGEVAMTGAALFYLASSTLAISASFLLAALVDGDQPPIEAIDDPSDELIQFPEEEVGIPISTAMGTLGLAFLACALVIAGLPPLSGFVAKLSLMSAALDRSGQVENSIPVASWVLLIMLVLSGFVVVITLTQAGIRLFWASTDRTIPRLRLVETAPIFLLIFLCVVQTVEAGPFMRFMQATAESLHSPEEYVRRVLDSNPTKTINQVESR